MQTGFYRVTFSLPPEILSHITELPKIVILEHHFNCHKFQQFLLFIDSSYMTITATKIFSNIVIYSLYIEKIEVQKTDLPYVAQKINSKHVPRIQVSQPFVQILFFIMFSCFTIQFPSCTLLAPLQFLCKPGSSVYTQFYWSLLSSIRLCHVCFSVSLSTVFFTWLSRSILWTLIACVVSFLQTLLSFLCIYSFYLFFHSAIMSYWRLPGITAFQQ